MTIDSATAGMLVDYIGKHACDQQKLGDVVDIIKELPSSNGPSETARKFFELNQGKRVKVKSTSYTGTLIKLNESTQGFYPGSLFPFYVRIETTEKENYNNAIGCVFEYGEDQVELIEE